MGNALIFISNTPTRKFQYFTQQIEKLCDILVRVNLNLLGSQIASYASYQCQSAGVFIFYSGIRITFVYKSVPVFDCETVHCKSD